MDTFEKVCDIITDNMGLNAGYNFTAETEWADLDADSLDVVDVIMSIEDEFGLEIPDEDISAIQNMGDLVSYIDSKK